MIQRQRIRLGDVLVQKQVITPEDLQKALKEQKNRGTKLGETLMSMGLVSEQQMVEVLTEMLHIDYVDIFSLSMSKLPSKLLASLIEIHGQTISFKIVLSKSSSSNACEYDQIFRFS